MIIFYLTNVSYAWLYTTSWTVQQNRNSCARRLVSTQTSPFSLSFQTRKPLHKVAYLLPKTSFTPRPGSSVLSSSLLWCGVGVWGWVGWGSEVMRWDFKALCLLRVSVISGGRGEVWRCRPWILVTGCWWSPPTSPGTPHSRIYSQRCRSRSWAIHRPTADTREESMINTTFL